MSRQLRMATRGSDLALAQSGRVAERIRHELGWSVETVVVKTTGDRRQDVLLGDAGAIGLFTAEVQEAVLSGRADFAVHSYKDLPATQVRGLCLAAVPELTDSCDLLLVPRREAQPLQDPIPLPAGARVGTSAARRTAFLKALRPDLKPTLLRGNVPTRVEKLRRGEYEGILLAAAGVQRLQLDLSPFEVHPLAPEFWPGAPGQGALALECRAEDTDLRTAFERLHDAAGARRIQAERLLLRALGGGCGLPLGAHAFEQGPGRLGMHAALGPTPNRPQAPLLARATVHAEEPEALAEAARQALLAERLSEVS